MGTHNRCDDSSGGSAQVHSDISPGAQESLAHCTERRGLLVPHEAGGRDEGGGGAGGGGQLAGDQQVHGSPRSSPGSGRMSESRVDGVLPLSDNSEEWRQ